MPDFVRVASTADLADGEMRQVSADGHDAVAASLRHRFSAENTWQEVAMRPLVEEAGAE